MKYHVKGYCFKDCKNKNSHRVLEGEDKRKTDKFIKELRGEWGIEQGFSDALQIRKPPDKEIEEVEMEECIENRCEESKEMIEEIEQTTKVDNGRRNIANMKKDDNILRLNERERDIGEKLKSILLGKSDKIRQVLLTRVRNLNTLSREEFDALPAAELQNMVKDPVLIRFIFEDRKYRADELVGIVKRIKEWGNLNN